MVVALESLAQLSEAQLREMLATLVQAMQRRDTELVFKQTVIDKLTHENAVLKRLKFAAQSERYSAEQRSLLDETLDADLQAVSEEIAQNTSPALAGPAWQAASQTPAAAGQPAAPRDTP